MEITTKVENGETVLKVTGCLDTAATAGFVPAVEAAAAGVKRLVFDFTDLEFIASSALRQLVSVDKRLSAAGGEVVLTGMNDVVRDVFDVTGLNEVFTIR